MGRSAEQDSVQFGVCNFARRLLELVLEDRIVKRRVVALAPSEAQNAEKSQKKNQKTEKKLRKC